MRKYAKELSLMKGSKHRVAYVSEYDNGGELVGYLDKTPIAPKFHDKGALENWDSGFTGCKSAEEAKKMAKYGWECDGVEQVKKAMKVHDSKVGMEKTAVMYADVQGFMPIVPNALMGLPQSMLNIKKIPRKNRVIHVVYNATFSAYVDTDDMIKTGLKVLARVMKLESMGFRVRLTAWQDYGSKESYEGPGMYALTMKIKDEGMPLDAKRLAYPMFHPSYFRGLGFGWYERQADAERFSGYGQPMGTYMSVSETDTLCKEVYGDKAVFIDGMRLYKMDEKEGERYLDKRFESKAI